MSQQLTTMKQLRAASPTESAIRLTPAGEALSSAARAIPCLMTRDARATARFYTEELGFAEAHVHPEGDDPDSSPPTFCSVAAGHKAAANIYFFTSSQDCEGGKGFQTGQVMVWLGSREVDDLYEIIKKREKVQIADKIDDKPWGYRQFDVKDEDGNRITFFRFLDDEPAANK